jgi:hypothetical protein
VVYKDILQTKEKTKKDRIFGSVINIAVDFIVLSIYYCHQL